MPRGQKNSYGCRRRRRRTVCDEKRGGGDWSLPLQSDRTHARASEETDRPATCRFRNLRFVHIDGVARQGSDTQQRLRTSRSDLCRACPSQARREFAPTPSLILPILAAHHSLSSADFITNIAESSFRHTHPIDSSIDTHQI